MGGDITIQSEPGKGSIFTLTCPFSLTDGAKDSPNAATQDDARKLLRGAKILLVEDNEINQEIAMKLLEKAGAQVTVMSNGREAVSWAEDMLRAAAERSEPDWKPDFDLILMDVQMPVMDGYAATRALRGLGLSLPIVAITAHTLTEERERCLAAGMDEHISKPIDVPDLYITLARWIRPGASK